MLGLNWRGKSGPRCGTVPGRRQRRPIRNAIGYLSAVIMIAVRMLAVTMRVAKAT
jgi:hypothetical protein